jgi:hypothetical protein
VLNPAPETLICETVTLEFPLFVSVTACVLLVPTNTLPKLRLVGLAESCSVVAMPVPLKVRVDKELAALVTTVMLPVTLPALVGANTTLICTLWPGARFWGTVKGPVLNPGPETPTCEIVTLPLPVFVHVTVWVVRLPTLTFPKLTLGGLAERFFLAGGSAGLGAPTSAQPARAVVASSANVRRRFLLRRVVKAL